MNGVAWCAIFVWWCFKKAGMKCPFGKCAYVPTIASRLSKKRVRSPKAGDIRIVSGNSHIGIYVGNGKVIAGNSGDRVRYEAAGGKYYRPSYSKATTKSKNKSTATTKTINSIVKGVTKVT